VALISCSSALRIFRERQERERPSLEVGFGANGQPIVVAKRQSPERLDFDDENFVLVRGGGNHRSNAILDDFGGSHVEPHSPVRRDQGRRSFDSHSSGGNQFSQSSQSSNNRHNNNQFSEPQSSNNRHNDNQFNAPQRSSSFRQNNNNHQSQPISFDRHNGGQKDFGALFGGAAGSGRDQFVLPRERSRSSNVRFSHDSGRNSGRSSSSSRHDHRFAPVSRSKSIKIPNLPIRLVITRRH